MNSRRHHALWWALAPVVLGACVQIVGIEDPKPIGDASGGGGAAGRPAASPWAGWHMPNPASAGLPNPSKYAIDTDKDVVTDQVTGLMWQRTVNGNQYTWEEAKTYCQDLDHAGYQDWRLPFRIELVSIVDYTKSGPAIDSAFANTPSADFWTASDYPDVSGYAWAIEFNEGDTYPPTTNSALRARCVR